MTKQCVTPTRLCPETTEINESADHMERDFGIYGRDIELSELALLRKLDKTEAMCR